MNPEWQYDPFDMKMRALRRRRIRERRRRMMKPEWQPILQHRSALDKIGIAIDCDVMPVGQLNIVSELVREGIMEWFDRAFIPHIAVMDHDGKARQGVNCDVYKLTEKGIALCDENGIERGPENKADSLYVVRFYDGMDNQWMDVSRPVALAEAQRLWLEKTKGGTEKTTYGDINYYKVFSANTKMLYSEGFGER